MALPTGSTYQLRRGVMNVTLVDHQDPQFPDPALALTEPNGLLAIGGNLAPETLLKAYRQGIFPWFSDEDPLLWWSPNPRAVIFPEQLHISKSLAKLQRQQRFQVSINQAFERVVAGCSAPRSEGDETWITGDMAAAYTQLHQQGHAHSVEVWNNGELVGGLYGVAIGGVFCGESMFSCAANASKLALLVLLERMPTIRLIDCQLPNPHLQRLGAVVIPRSEFMALLQRHGDTQIQWPRGTI